MECEFCAMEGTAGEANIKCSECGEWVCDIHLVEKGKQLLCPTCFEAASDDILEEDLEEDTEEVD